MNSSRPGLVILIRHGQTDFNLQRRFQGQLDVPLNEEGREQAIRAGLFLGGLFEAGEGKRNLKLTSFFTSDLSRATETASLLKEKMIRKPAARESDHFLLDCPIQTTQMIREINVGAFQGYTFSTFQSEFPKVCSEYMEQYESNPKETAYPNGESAGDVSIRMKAFYQAHQRQMLLDLLTKANWHDRHCWAGTKTEIIVSHGAALRILLSDLAVKGIEEPSEKESSHLFRQKGSHPRVHFSIGNADCIIIGHFADGVKLLYHARNA